MVLRFSYLTIIIVSFFSASYDGGLNGSGVLFSWKIFKNSWESFMWSDNHHVYIEKIWASARWQAWQSLHVPFALVGVDLNVSMKQHNVKTIETYFVVTIAPIIKPANIKVYYRWWLSVFAFKGCAWNEVKVNAWKEILLLTGII